jgi:hypothetical protein
MLPRTLETIAFSDEMGRQMRFIAGPRQCGKTTLAKTQLKRMGMSDLYYNWDLRDVKTRYYENPSFLREALHKKKNHSLPWVAFDEIHKLPKWKNILKGLFDDLEPHVRFVITGSARLDLFRRSGDSLAGRYFLFHLFPLSLRELKTKKNHPFPFDENAAQFIEGRLGPDSKSHQETMEALLHLSGFPEPFLKGTNSYLRLWQRDSVDRIVRGDLRDLSRIQELETVARLITLLPERIGNPLSVNSLKEDLESSHPTVKQYLNYLKLLYFIFEVPPYSKKVNRALKKDKKIYFFDWTLTKTAGSRFENYIAVEVANILSQWHDQGLGDFQLTYIRTRNGHECDFLILKNRSPWLMIEAKVKADKIPSHLFHFSEKLGKIPIVVLVQENSVLQIRNKNAFVVSASRFLGT